MKPDPEAQPPGPVPSSFVARRWARAYHLGRPLSLGLLLALVALGAFAAIAACAVQPTGLGNCDRTLDQYLRRPDVMTPAGERFFQKVSDLGSYPAMVGVAIAVTLLLFVRLWWLVAVGVLFTVLVEPTLNQRMKEAFQLPRPPRAHPTETRPQPKSVGMVAWSPQAGLAGDLGLADLYAKDPKKPASSSNDYGFPSGHAMGSTVGYGMLGYVLMLWSLPRRWIRVAVLTVLTVLILLIAFSRLYLHAHYLSQVIGGCAAGAFWIILCMTLIEVVRRRPQRLKNMG